MPCVVLVWGLKEHSRFYTVLNAALDGTWLNNLFVMHPCAGKRLGKPTNESGESPRQTENK